MHIDTEQFRRDGYLIIREAVPPEHLGNLRISSELMVDEMKRLSRRARQPEDPFGGSWYAQPQPRVEVERVVTEETANLVDFYLGESVLGVSQPLLDGPEIAISSAQISCSGLIDYGFTAWHRDASAATQAPTTGMQADLMDNSWGYVQWNIALYDDDVFWFLPGSHRAPTTEQQRQELLMDGFSEIIGGIPIDLRAGDGFVYLNLGMHGGRYYSSKMRRTIHLGFRAFGVDVFPGSFHCHWDRGLGFTRHLSEQARKFYTRSAELYTEERDLVEFTLRAVAKGNEVEFSKRLAELHPGEQHRMVAVVLLYRIATKITLIHSPENAMMTVEERKKMVGESPPSEFSENLAGRFTTAESAALGRRFAELARRLAADARQVEQHYTEVYEDLNPGEINPPDFESRPLRCFHSEMPVGFGVDEFVASWQ